MVTPAKLRARFAPTSVGALMDPVFLRRAVNDLAATADAGGAQATPLRPWPTRLVARVAAAFAGRARRT